MMNSLEKRSNDIFLKGLHTWETDGKMQYSLPRDGLEALDDAAVREAVGLLVVAGAFPGQEQYCQMAPHDDVYRALEAVGFVELFSVNDDLMVAVTPAGAKCLCCVRPLVKATIDLRVAGALGLAGQDAARVGLNPGGTRLGAAPAPDVHSTKAFVAV